MPEKANENPEWDGLISFLFQCRRVTEGHIKKSGHSWSIQDQICHVHSEASEVYTAVRKAEGFDRELEEIADCIFSSITLAHIGGYTDEELLDALIKKLRIIEKRAGV